MEEIRSGCSDVLSSLRENRNKVNEVVRWINAEKERHRKARKRLHAGGWDEGMKKALMEFKRELVDPNPREETMEDEILENVGRCLRAYGEREESTKRMPFNRDFGMGDNGYMAVTIVPYVAGKGFKLTVAVNRR